MTPEHYLSVKKQVEKTHADEINWANSIKPCESPEAFASEAMWVIINSGMRYTVAVQIWERVKLAYQKNKPLLTAFGHHYKVEAMEYVIANKEKLFWEFTNAKNDADKMAALINIPFIGEMTKYHLAKNLGLEVCKPDRHVQRIADYYNTTPGELCNRLKRETGDKITVIDTVLWRASERGIINTMEMGVEE